MNDAPRENIPDAAHPRKLTGRVARGQYLIDEHAVADAIIARLRRVRTGIELDPESAVLMAAERRLAAIRAEQGKAGPG